MVSRYGKRPREKYFEIKEKIKKKQCSFCKSRLKKIAAGIWFCKKCKKKFASSFY